ncbi:MAG: hypothetical protein ACJ8FS_04900 [Sphingomicrobium sp.]
MRIRPSVTFLAGMLVLSPMASALAAEPAQMPKETPIGTRIPKSIDLFPIDNARPILTAFGECAAKSNPALARDFILHDLNYRLGISERFKSLASPGCLTQAIQGTPYGMVRLEMTSAVLRYAIADALIRSDLATFDPDVIRFAAPLAELKIEPGVGEAKSLGQSELDRAAKALATANSDLALFTYGECIVRAAPAKTKALLSTKVNSTEEGDGLANLMPDFRGCLDKGQQFRANRLILRGVVAYNYYRLAYAPRVQSRLTADQH